MHLFLIKISNASEIQSANTFKYVCGRINVHMKGGYVSCCVRSLSNVKQYLIHFKKVTALFQPFITALDTLSIFSYFHVATPPFSQFLFCLQGSKNSNKHENKTHYCQHTGQILKLQSVWRMPLTAV